MITKLLHSSFAGLLLICLVSCSPEEAAKPTYVKIDALHLQTDYTEEGSAHSKITTVWITLNGQSAGAFELPAIVPLILKNGSNDLRLEAGINTNGITSFKAINTSFTPINYELEYQSTGSAPDTITIPEADLQLSYRSFFSVNIVEDFDDPGLNFQRTNFSDTNFVKTDNADSIFQFTPFGANSPEPNAESGVIYLDALNPQVDLLSNIGYDIPLGVLNVYLEVSYRSNVNIGFGLWANLPSGDRGDITAGVLPKTEWSKIYINLISEFQAFQGATDYQIMIRAEKPDDVPEARIYLDNIKLVYQQWKKRHSKPLSIKSGMG